MPRIAIVLAVVVAGFTGLAGTASAQNTSSGGDAAQQTAQLAAQSRPRITVRPRTTKPGPDSQRYCESWLATEHRPSGTVITPQMRCWWQ
jgi:hypothetical protein